MNRAELVEKLNALDLDKQEYWLITGGAMVLYGLREQTHDVDLGCTSALADRLEQTYPTTINRFGTRWIRLDDDVELFENWLHDGVETVDGIPVISLQGLLEMKKELNREKDLRDIQRIEAYLENSGKHTEK